MRLQVIWSLLLLECSLCATAFPALAKEVPKTLALIQEKKCTSCHSFKAFGIGTDAEAPDLSRLSSEILKQPQAEAFLKDLLMKRIEWKERKHKKIFKGTEEELSEIVRFLLDQSETRKP